MNNLIRQSKHAIKYLSYYANNEKQKKAINKLIDMVNMFADILDYNPNSKIIDIMLLNRFRDKYIDCKNPQLAISEVMKDITDGFDLDTQFRFTRYNVAEEIRSNQTTQEDVETLYPLVDEVLETMKNQIEWITSK